MSDNLFCARGIDMPCSPRRYEDCGLDNIWLMNGFTIVHHNGEDLIEPEDVDGLHKAIAQHLVRYRKSLGGREIRFIRRAIDMTQGELAHRLGTGVQSVARWEKNKVVIPGPEDRLLRLTALLAILDPSAFSKLLDVSKVLDDLDEGPEQPVRFAHNHHWAETMLEAA